MRKRLKIAGATAAAVVDAIVIATAGQSSTRQLGRLGRPNLDS